MHGWVVQRFSAVDGREGFGVELLAPSTMIVVAEIFASDVDGSFELTTFSERISVPVIEWFIREARRRIGHFRMEAHCLPMTPGRRKSSCCRANRGARLKSATGIATGRPSFAPPGCLEQITTKRFTNWNAVTAVKNMARMDQTFTEDCVLMQAARRAADGPASRQIEREAASRAHEMSVREAPNSGDTRGEILPTPAMR